MQTRNIEQSLEYRIGDYSRFLRDLLEHVHSQTLTGDEHAEKRPLANLDTDAHNEWTVGLFKAWAEVGDILSFYQERIANEGFLPTAREERSIREIVRLIDYVPAPGVASTTELSYKVLELPGAPEVVVVPRRASVVSVPERKELPQSWETVEELRARADWNALRPLIPTVELGPMDLLSTVSVDLDGHDLGLEAGSPLLLEVVRREQPAPVIGPFFRRLVAVAEIEPETSGGPRVTRVTLETPLIDERSSESSSAPSYALKLLRVSTFDHALDLFGSDAPEWADLDAETKARYAQPQGGVVVSDANGTWTSINEGLPEDGAGPVLAAPDGSVYAGTANGVFRSVDGETWRRSGTDLIGQEILALATDGQQQIFAGTAKNGVLRSTDGETWEVLLGEAVRESLLPLGRGRLPRSGRLPLSPVRAILPARGQVFAGTDHGVFVFVAERDTWQAVNRGLPDWAAKTGRAGVVVQALVAGDRTGELFAGTDQGVFASANDGRSWTPRNRGFPGLDPESGGAKVSVLALHWNHDPRTHRRLLMAGSDLGVFRSTDGGHLWETASLGLPATDVETGLSKTPVSALVLAANPTTLETNYFAATPRGLLVSTDAGVYWSLVGDTLTARPIAGLVASGRGGVIAAVPTGGFDRDRWPRFWIRDGELDLKDAPLIEEGDWLVIEDPANGPLLEIVRAAHVQQVARLDFSLEAAVTRVIADRPLSEEKQFNLRTTRVLAGSRSLPLPSGRKRVLEPLPRAAIELDPSRKLEPFPSSRRVIVDGKLLRARLRNACTLRTSEGTESIVTPDDEPQVVRATEVGTNRWGLRLRMEGGTEGDVTVDRSELEWRPSLKDDPPIAESVVAVWSDSGAASKAPTLGLQPALRYCYDPSTVRLLANITTATQGRTVYRDVLGSGDAARSHQRFTLSAPALTYLPSASGQGWTSSLEIRIEGIRWRHVESLFEAKPTDRVYMIRHDMAGVATVIFGDGVHGARLPTGRQNVVALYRSGHWVEGVHRGRLTVPETKPLGLDGVTNPLPAAPGSRPETPDSARLRAPVGLRTLGRVVSLLDYEDFCRAYPGIAQARVAELASPDGPMIHVTVAPEIAGSEPDFSLLASTIKAARARRAQLVIESCCRVFFDLEALIRHPPEHRPQDVERRVRELLIETYGYQCARFGDRVSASEIVERIGAVPGVVSVRLERFHRSALEPSTQPLLRARAAHWDAAAQRISSAELLELRPVGGLVLNLEVDG